MLALLVYIAVVAIILIVVFWIVGQVPLPDPIKKIITIALVVIAAVILIGILLSFAGLAPAFPRLR